ncbi:MAG: penicillin-binding protein [Candidatus Liptonbacteria bacterium CG11_big_fil_rev_8_21_14_0_20_35_14]|uniref:Penicillin-binding protein n=1 Tax=Candidatus Liptonbacteria bacterium CG11_big_fil_rev_8_21_14_0_20_35_14 TaxID=1974634 RepID=A0A2H0N7X3_9BACT|nr:MAG: penicillin-binding protein [Candidatus Liptonbacteria bacterium CG11_big_fil_rev_8_21_14_0_20_35_14]
MKNTFFIFFSIFILLISGIFIYISYISLDIPDVNQISNNRINQSTKIYDRSQEILLYEIHGEEKRTVVSFDNIPDIIKQATIATEDRNFYEHPAFDYKALIRAGFIDIIYGKKIGGSTITQQLAKNIFLSSDKTISRKIKELIIALKLEQRYAKDDILSLYLNQIPYGGNAYGIEAASQTYFNKRVEDINLAEATILASLPQAPSYYSPYGAHVDKLYERQKYILDQMINLGFITEDNYREAIETEISFTPQATTIKAPHFVMMVIDQLRDIYGEEMIQTGGLRVITTLDYDMQKLAEKVVTEGANRNYELYKGRNAALVAQEVKTGQILALVGSFDYFDQENEGNFNVAYQGLRQPGSAFKPFVYLTAFEKGYTPSTVLFDVETEFDTAGGPEASYTPHNFGNRFRGPISMRNSLAQSINVTAVKTLYLAGIDNTLETAKKLGINTLGDRSRFGLSLVLGGGEVRLTELVEAYSVLAQDGVKHNQSSILKVENSLGKVLYEWDDKSNRVYNEQSIRLINDVLSDVDARRGLFSSSLSLTTFPDYQVALKTGTTNDYVDAWAIGYSPSLVVGVWAGNNRREPMQQQGSSLLAALPIWNAFFKEAVKKYEPETFNKPDNIITTKPILQGDYTWQNQIHNILYYVKKDEPSGPLPENPERDPQFNGWESAVLKWAQNNIPNFSEYNKTRIFDYSNSLNPELSIIINSPKNGSYMQGGFKFEADINTNSKIESMELFINGGRIDSLKQDFDNSYKYNKTISLNQLETQNKISLVVKMESGAVREESVIVFK